MERDQGKTDAADGSSGPAALRGEAIKERLRRLQGWEVINQHHLHKEYHFPDFVTALAFVNRIGELAESAGHHPDLTLGWGRVCVELFTHRADGLTDQDFELAARTDELPR